MLELHIVGGTYYEVCTDPNWNELYGSGFRAAHALSGTDNKIVYHTAIGEGDYEALACMAKSININ